MGISDVDFTPSSPAPPPKPVDIWLWCFAVVIALLLFVIPKTPVTISLCLISMFALLIHPLWNQRLVEQSLLRRLSALAVLAVVLAGLGRLAWPSPQEPQISIRRIMILHRAKANTETLYATVDYQNDGSQSLETVEAIGSLFVSADPAKQDYGMERARAEADKAFAANPPIPSIIGPHEGRTMPFTGPSLSRAEYRDFRAGHYRFYVAGFIDAKGEAVMGRVLFCGFSQGRHDEIFMCPKRGEDTHGRFP